MSPPETPAQPSAPTDAETPVIGTPDELEAYVWNTFGVRIPKVRVCTHHQAPWDAFCAGYFATNEKSVIVIKGSRGLAGKSWLLALLGTVIATTLRGDVTILGGSSAQSNRVHRAMAKFWGAPNAPHALLTGEPGVTRTEFRDGQTIEALTASQKSARGPHPLALILDEVDEMDWKLYEATAGQTMDAHGYTGRTVIGSTHQHADGTMTAILKLAAERGWQVFEWCVAADTMIATPSGERRIDSLHSGAWVYAFTGTAFIPAKISEAWSNGTKQTVRVLTDRGSIECTAQHKLYTDRGWIEAGRLKRDDRLLGMWSASQEEQDSDRLMLGLLPEGVWMEDSAAAERVDKMSLRRQEMSGLEDVSKVLPVGSWEAQHGDERNDGARQGNCTRQAAVEPGGEGRNRLRSARPTLRAMVSGRDVRSGLLSAGPQDRGGMLRRLAPQGASLDARHPARRSDLGGRPWLCDPVRPRYAHVVEVAPGRCVDVWDIAVPGWHSFIANGFVAHNCWKETLEPHGWLTAAQVVRKRAEMTAEMWRVEVELGEPSIEGRAIFTEKVERMFVGEPVLSEGAEFGYREFEPPVPGATYATGADWARTRDYVEIVTFRCDVYPLRLVAYQRFTRRATHYIVSMFERQTDRYPGSALHDATSLGGKIMDDMVGTDDWENVSVVDGFDFGKHRQRQIMFTDYIIAIEAEEVISPRIDVLYKQHKFVRNDDLRGQGHPPDGFVAGALAYKASLAVGRPLRVVGGLSRAQAEAAAQLAPSGLARTLSLLQKPPGGNGAKGA